MKETKIFAQFLIRNILKERKENREKEEKEGEAEGGQGFQTTYYRLCRLGPSPETTEQRGVLPPPEYTSQGAQKSGAPSIGGQCASGRRAAISLKELQNKK